MMTLASNASASLVMSPFSPCDTQNVGVLISEFWKIHVFATPGGGSLSSRHLSACRNVPTVCPAAEATLLNRSERSSMSLWSDADARIMCECAASSSFRPFDGIRIGCSALGTLTSHTIRSKDLTPNTPGPVTPSICFLPLLPLLFFVGTKLSSKIPFQVQIFHHPSANLAIDRQKRNALTDDGSKQHCWITLCSVSTD